jgi:DegV family protein with EDD domain
VQRRVRLYAALDTVEYLRRGGRASWLTAMLGELLQVKPLIEVRDGEVLALAKLRTRVRVREGLAGLVEALGRLERLAVIHTNCLDGAQELAARLASCCAEPPIILEATSVIGTHAGPGAVGAAPLAAA